MAAIITEKFRQHNAKAFYDTFGTADNNLYLTIGKSSSWSNEGGSNSDALPPVPQDDMLSNFSIWNDMVAAKMLSAGDVSFVIPKRMWQNGQDYAMYDDTNTNLYDSTFYFMTSEYKVYKVLYNDNGAPYNGSEPNFDETGSTIAWSENYLLQYMYTLSVSEIQKFVTNDFIPVKNNEDSLYSPSEPGGINAIKVIPGSGYTNGIYYTTVIGDGVEEAIIKIKVDSNSIASFGSTNITTEIIKAGKGYTFGKIDLINNIFKEESYDSDTGTLNKMNGSESNLVPNGINTDGSGSGGSIVPIISPSEGHGSNAIRELGGHYVLMNTRLEQDEGADFTVENDFRRVCIVKNPKLWDDSLATLATARVTKAIRINESPVPGTFQIDEKITQDSTGAVGRVVEWDSEKQILYYVQEKYVDYGTNNNGELIEFSGSGVIQGTSGATGTPKVISETVGVGNGNNIDFVLGYAVSELKPYTGEIIYVENRRPISRASDQSEDIKIIVEF